MIHSSARSAFPLLLLFDLRHAFGYDRINGIISYSLLMTEKHLY